MKVISVAGDRVAILLGGQDTNGQYTIMEAALPPNGGPPPHVHKREDESFMVLVGEVTFYLGDKTIVLHKGDSLFAPRDIPHYFKNTGTRTFGRICSAHKLPACSGTKCRTGSGAEHIA